MCLLLIVLLNRVILQMWFPQPSGVEGAGLVPQTRGLPGASFGFYLREALQSPAHIETILYNESY